MRRGTLAIAVVFALVLAACSGGDDPSSGSSDTTTTVGFDTGPSESSPPDVEAVELPELDPVTAPEWEPTTRSEELALQVGSAQQITLQMAIDATALLDPEFPGATPTTLPPGDGLPLGLTLWLIDQFREHLTDEQVAALDRLLEAEPVATITPDGEITLLSGDEPQPGADTTTTAGVSGLRSSAPSADPVKDRYTALMADVLRRYKLRLPAFSAAMKAFDMSFSQQMFVGDSGKGGMAARLEASGACSITVGRALWSDADVSDDEILVFYAHEIFHCYQQWQNPGFVTPLWVREGGADWFAFDLLRNQVTPRDRAVFSQWFTSTATPLEARKYDAWPLYEMALRYGIDPLQVMNAQFQLPQGSSTGSYLSIEQLDRLPLRLDWSSRTTRMQSTADPAWTFSWPGPNPNIPPFNTATRQPPKGIGQYPVIYPGTWTHPAFAQPMTGDVDIVTIFAGDDALSIEVGGRTFALAAKDSVRLCLRPDKCQCPGGQSAAVPVGARLVTFAPAAREAKTTHRVRNQRWDPDVMCKDEPQTAQSNGDPHLETFDGVVYDSMTLGEFVYARDPDGGFEIQGRHVSAALPGAAATAAVAVSDGEHRITFSYHDDGPNVRPVVRVDGDQTDEHEFDVGDLAVGVNLDGETTVTWPDGSWIELDSTVGWWFYEVHAMPDRAARLEGLLGSGDWDLRNDLRMPDGEIVGIFETLGTDAPHTRAWQVDEDTTLFDYGPGESIEFFRVAHPDPVALEPSDDDVDRCADALGPDALEFEVEWCAFDLTASDHDDELVDMYVVVVEQRVAEPPSFDDEIVLVPGTTVPRGPDAQPGQAGEPTARLEGVLAASYSPDVLSGEAVGALDASVDAVEGTVLLIRTDSCDSETIVFVSVTQRETGSAALPFLCDPARVDSPPGDEDDEGVNGEAIVWISQGGVYDVELTSDSEEPLAIDAEVFVDPTPTIVGRDDLDGASVELSGIGDTVVFETGIDASSYAVEGLDEACGLVAYGAPAPGEMGPWALSHCVHSQELVAPGNAGVVIPVIAWNRVDRTVTVALTRS